MTDTPQLLARVAALATLSLAFVLGWQGDVSREGRQSLAQRAAQQFPVHAIARTARTRNTASPALATANNRQNPEIPSTLTDRLTSAPGRRTQLSVRSFGRGVVRAARGPGERAVQ
jgi:hypothetical protein